MDPLKLQPRKRYYSVLDLNNDASTCAIRSAYKRLAMKWHPDKCNNVDRAEAKRKFQELQEAYAVLSDERKKMLYDSGLYDPEDDEEDIEGLSSFLNEMSGMMADVQASEKLGKGSSLKELQQLFVNMFSTDLAAFNDPCLPSASSISFDRKRAWGGGDYDATSYIEACIMEETSQTRYFFNDAVHYGNNANISAPKKTKCGKVGANGVHPNVCQNGGNGLHTITRDNI